MREPHFAPASGRGPLTRWLLVVVLAAIPFQAGPARGDAEDAQTFHLNEITHLMVGFNGDATIQALELKLLSASENLVGGVQINTYDRNGVFVATLGTFPGSVPNGSAGDRILCATANFQATLGITPDLVITPGIPSTTGQIAFEKPTCRVNVLPYGDIAVPVGGTSAAAPLPAGGATALFRTVDSAISACPASVPEDAAMHFVLRSGSPGAPIVFQNNSRATVNVSSTVTSVDATPPASRSLRVSPNPFQGATRIEAPAPGSLTIHDVRGRLVRVLTRGPEPFAPAGAYRADWDGTDGSGRKLPSGIYLVRYAGAAEVEVTRVVLIR
jgi:hypothetical protein